MIAELERTELEGLSGGGWLGKAAIGVVAGAAGIRAGVALSGLAGAAFSGMGWAGAAAVATGPVGLTIALAVCVGASMYLAYGR